MRSTSGSWPLFAHGLILDPLPRPRASFKQAVHRARRTPVFVRVVGLGQNMVAQIPYTWLATLVLGVSHNVFRPRPVGMGLRVEFCRKLALNSRSKNYGLVPCKPRFLLWHLGPMSGQTGP